jgi:hypothetical protein
MAEVPEQVESVRYSTTPAWWTPALLLLVLVPKQLHSSQSWWWFADAGLLALSLLILYELTHPSLSFTAHSISQRRGPFRATIDLDDLRVVRVVLTQRRTNVIDPQTGERRSVVRFYYKQPDDWGGKPPVQGFSLRDGQGHHLTLGVAHTGASRWGTYLLRAIEGDDEVELGPRVVEALRSVTR